MTNQSSLLSNDLPALEASYRRRRRRRRGLGSHPELSVLINEHRCMTNYVAQIASYQIVPRSSRAWGVRCDDFMYAECVSGLATSKRDLCTG